MNYIGINGGTLKQRDLVKKAIDFAITEMMPRFKTLDIYVDILRKLDGGVLDIVGRQEKETHFKLSSRENVVMLMSFSKRLCMRWYT